MKTFKTLAVIAAAWLSTSAWSANGVPAGTVITGQVTGASTTLLGLDHLFADEPGSHVTKLVADDLEFLTGDYVIGIDFLGDGRVQIFNNGDLASLPGSYTFTFSFAGLSQPIASFTALDLSSIGSGSVGLQVVNPNTVSLTLTNLTFNSDYGSFTTQLNVAAVPEPASLALMGAGLGLLALRRRVTRAAA